MRGGVTGVEGGPRLSLGKGSPLWREDTGSSFLEHRSCAEAGRRMSGGAPLVIWSELEFECWDGVGEDSCTAGSRAGETG